MVIGNGGNLLRGLGLHRSEMAFGAENLILAFWTEHFRAMSKADLGAFSHTAVSKQGS